MRYIGTKLVDATPMTREAYNDMRGWTLPKNENGADEGFMVEYVDGGKPNMPNHAGYVSWSPKDVFEAAYRPCHQMTFGLALEALRRGDTVARTGWNGQGMFVYLVPANSYPADTGAAKARFGWNARVPYNAYLALVGVDNSVSTWVPSISDCLAEDWAVVTVNPGAAPDGEAPRPRLAHQERVITERGDLADKISKLHAFTVSDMFKRLDDEEQGRMTNQLAAMRLYCTVLNQRIEAFPV